MEIRGPESAKPWGLWAAIAGIAMVAGFLFLPFFRTNALTPFEIGNFVGQAETYSHKQKAWVALKRGQVFNSRTQIRTGLKQEVTLLVRGRVQLRLKEDSLLENDSKRGYRLKLLKGTLLGTAPKQTGSQSALEIVTPVSVARIQEANFRIDYQPNAQRMIATVLQGKMDVSTESLKGKQWVTVQSLEKAEVAEGKLPEKPTVITREEWGELRETYELIQKSAEFEALQRTMSQEAGNLFNYIFDHGTFYMPQFGYALREFERDESGGDVYFDVQYDVFPRGTFAGVYMKTRDLDLARFEALEFQIRQMPDEHPPESFRIEFKFKGQVVRAFTSKVIPRDWRREVFQFQATKPTSVTEVTFVFTHEKVGEHKTGAIQIQDINLIPAETGTPSSRERGEIKRSRPAATTPQAAV